ncbi:DUF4190 domain-containing protein [Actinoplanes sp. NPDC051513]|uniref:DUF4190 domain-containing protein n=1 Tax=Actinoplanes sp. NPDC051513 TaxID=3363908 RepID=UPI0037A294C7
MSPPPDPGPALPRYPHPATDPPPPGYVLAYPAPYGYPDRPGYPPPPPPDPEEGWNGFAIAALVAGILGGVMFSLAFGITALIQLRRSGQRGRGLAIAGLACSGVWVLTVVVLIVSLMVSGIRSDVTAGSSSDRGGVSASSTRGSDPAAITATGYAPGDCLDDVDDYDTMRKVNCTVGHDGEVFAVFNLPNRPWPGESEVSDEADERCGNYLDSYVEQPYAFEYFSYYPSEDLWPGDRSVICIAYDQEGQLFGSIHH